MCPAEDLLWECDVCGKTLDFDKDAITIQGDNLVHQACIIAF
jgi:hypothetical protein